MEAKNGAYIVSTVRTAVGKAKRGALVNMRPEEMGGVVVNEAINRVSGLEKGQVDDVLIGCAMPEGPQGMNMGRVIAQKAGLPDSVPGATINRFCSSGLQTIVMASQAIMAGHTDIVVAGGSESMSQVPMAGFYFQPDPDVVMEDPDVYISMGNTGENVATKYDVSREDQDRFAYQSHQRAIDAIKSGRFAEEIVKMDVENVFYKDGKTQSINMAFDTDEGPRSDTSVEALGKLRPVFRAGGTVTAGNASQMSDGAAASVVVSAHALKELGVDPMARLAGYAVAGVAPEIMGVGPIDAIKTRWVQ